MPGQPAIFREYLGRDVFDMDAVITFNWPSEIFDEIPCRLSFTMALFAFHDGTHHSVEKPANGPVLSMNIGAPCTRQVLS
jgi:hypothetical protein